jgi:hypothetical protein
MHIPIAPVPVVTPTLHIFLVIVCDHTIAGTGVNKGQGGVDLQQTQDTTTTEALSGSACTCQSNAMPYGFISFDETFVAQVVQLEAQWS